MPAVVGVHFSGQTLPRTVDLIARAERAGVQSAWLTSGGLGADSLTTLAVAATRTERILMGTSIAVTFSRHPIAMIQQAVAIEQLAPGRLRLGIGPSHRATIEGTYGLAFERPLEHLREYAIVLRQAFHGGVIDHKGARFTVQARVPDPPTTPVYLSALRPASYELAGELSDGAIAWVTPSAFLRDVARPALQRGAARAKAPPPRLVAHAVGLVSDDADAKRAARERVLSYTRIPFYQEMFVAAGSAKAREGILDDELVEELVLVGDSDHVERGVRRFLERGSDEVIVTLVLAGADLERSIDRTFRVLASVAASA